MSEVRYCSNCGAENIDRDAYCSNCGYKFKETVVKPSSEDEQEATSMSVSSFISDPPYGALIVTVTILLFLNSISGFVIWSLFMFYKLGFLIYAIVCISLAGCFFIYFLYSVFSKTYLIRNMRMKESFTSYKDILEKNLEILFDQKLFRGTTRKSLLIFLAVLMLIGFIGSIIAGIVVFFRLVNDYIWYY